MKFLKNEDNWSVVLGLFIVVVICTLYILQIPIANLNVKIKPWSDFSELFNLISHSILGLLSLAIGFGLLLFLGAKSAQPEIKLPPFLAKFILLFLMAAGVLILSSNKTVKAWQLESPLVALFIGLLLGNFTSIADKLKEVLRTEYYVKIGIILMGATLPFTTILKAGPAAIVQALIVSVVTFSTIYFVATKVFKLDNRFAATLGAGGSVCGVSASIAIGGACRAKHEHVAASISLVIVWAVIMIFALPFACKLLDLPPAIAGAWIGTSEFADAAGFAAVEAIGNESATQAFTLMKVVGRDMFVGLWAFLAAYLSVTVWERASTNERIDKSEIWRRFPKFIIGFFIASIITTLFVLIAPNAEAFNKQALGLIKDYRGWFFTLTFLSIGMTTRFKALASVGIKPVLAFTAGVLVNLPLGYWLSNHVFANYWINL